MRILLANKYFHMVGGAERYVLNLKDLMESHGHEVIPFSMEDSRNEHTEYSRYFPSNIDYADVSLCRAKEFPKIAGRVIYSPGVKRKIKALTRNTKPDIAHINNIYNQLSPSLLSGLKESGVPAVMTVHDYHLVCPNHSLFTNGAVCEKCLHGNYSNAVLRQCVKDSVAASALCALASYIHLWTRIYEKNVRTFITPSRFIAEKMIEGGLPRESIVTIPPSIDPSAYTPEPHPGKYLLYFGRLSPEKGIIDLLKAAEELPHIPIHIAGTGPQEQELQEYAKEKKLNTTFTGFIDGQRLQKEIQDARIIAAPSRIQENLPFTILEAMAYGKPVIATRQGGIPELIENGKNGLLCEPGNPTNLQEKITEIWDDDQRLEKMGQQGRKNAEQKHSPKNHYAKLMKVYANAQKK
ncbi:Trehalose synthase [uncultured archaeon]|nr:Trehalose synthase [uncultured archaeon]